MTGPVVLCLFVLFAFVNCNLIRSDQEIETKDVPIPREDIDNNDLKPTPAQKIDTDVVPLPMESGNRETAKCAKIGEFCSYHSQCCTRACLGYAKKCVSGSGLYPDYLDPPTA